MVQRQPWYRKDSFGDPKMRVILMPRWKSHILPWKKI